jgi:FtsZ-binding cell division protein ZapB
MVDPLFWLGLSILLVAVSLTAVLVAALPAIQELARAARSAEKLFDTLNRELPPTLEAIRLTGIEITSLKEDVSQNVQSAGRVVEQIDQSLTTAKQQARQAQVTTRSLIVGIRAAWQSFNRSRDASEAALSELEALSAQSEISERSLNLPKQTELEYQPKSQPDFQSSYQPEPKQR